MVHASLAGLSLAHPIELLAKAKATAQKAPELDSTLTDAHVTLGHVKVSEWDWDWAEREYQRALELSQSLVRVHAAYSEHLAIMGRHTEALRVVAEMRRLDPLNVGLMGIEGRIVCLARRYDESIERLRHAVGLGDAHSHFWLAAAYDAKQLHQLAVEQYQALINRFGDNPGTLAFLRTLWRGWGGGRKRRPRSSG